jgi:hypothetical protein
VLQSINWKAFGDVIANVAKVLRNGSSERTAGGFCQSKNTSRLVGNSERSATEVQSEVCRVLRRCDNAGARR